MKNIRLYVAMLLLPFFGMAQLPIGLEEAYQKALQNNPELKTGELKINYQEKMQKSYAVVDPVNISGEIGQFNSEKVDNQIGITQNLRFPKFYRTQQQVLLAETELAKSGYRLQKWQLKKELANVYNELNYLEEKQKLLQKADSIYAVYFSKASLRLKKGESNILETTTAENYRSQAKIQLNNVLKDRQVVLYQFNFLINDSEQYKNLPEDFFSMHVEINPDNYQGNILVLQPLAQQKAVEDAKLQAEKSKLLPSFSLGVISRTMHGVDLNNSGKRFQSGVLGLEIPLFNTAQKSVIEGQKINQLLAEQNYQVGLRNLKNQFQKQAVLNQKLQQEQEYYKTKGLANAQTIIKTADRLFYGGEINYLEWSILVSQSLELENKYIDNQKALNESIIELNALKNEK